MGYKCHVATKYEVKYDSGSLSYAQEYVNRLLNELCPELWYNSEYIVSADELEVPKEELKGAIETIKENRGEYAKEILEENAEFTVDDLIKSMEAWLEKGDPDNDFIRLCWY